jgi:cytochrome P450
MLIAYAIVATLACLYVLWSKGRNPGKLPGPFKDSLFGPLKTTVYMMRRRKRIYELLNEWRKEYGGVFSFQGIVGPEIVVVSDPSTVQMMLEDIETYPKGEQFQLWMRELLGNGIFNANGETWKFQRKLASHIFKIRALRESLPLMSKHCDKLLARLREAASDGQRSVDMQTLFMRFTLDTICDIIGIGEIGSLDKQVPFAEAFNAAQLSTVERFQVPLLQLLGPFRYFYSTERTLRQVMPTINEFVYDAIQRKRAESDDESRATDLLARYLRLEGVGAELSDEFLRDVATNLLLAGRDATSATLSFAVAELCQSPHIYARLAAEIEEVAAPGDASEPLDFDQLRSLKYMRGFIDEVLRRTPPVPIDPKFSSAARPLPDNSGRSIPPGCVVAWFAYGMGRDTASWSEPVEECRPERHMGVDSERARQHPFAFSPFQASYRRCLGEQLAYLEISLVLSRIVQAGIHFKADPKCEVTYTPNLTYVAKNGIDVFVSTKAQ